MTKKQNILEQIEDHYWMHQAINVLYYRVPLEPHSIPLESQVIDVDEMEVFKPKFRTSKEFADKLGAHRKAVKLRGLDEIHYSYHDKLWEIEKLKKPVNESYKKYVKLWCEFCQTYLRTNKGESDQ